MSKNASKQCQNCKSEFIIEPEDFEFYEKMKVPPPTFCPECRDQRRWSFRNERSLYKRKCGLCGKSIISIYSSDKPYTVYCPKCWYSDKWDPFEYGMDVDFSRPFLAQFRGLLSKVPRLSLVQENVVNSNWVNYERGAKNCYLCVGGEDNEDCSYLTYGLGSKEVLDGFWVAKSELCYELINCYGCYKTFFSHWCFDCRDAWFSYDCRNCSFVFGSAGLRNKQYYIFNRPCSEEEYQRKISEFFPLTQEKIKIIREKLRDVLNKMPRRDFIIKSLNSTGDYINGCKNCLHCWNADVVEDSKFHFVSAYCKDSYDISSIGWAERNYDCYSGIHLYGVKFSATTLGGSHLEYCENSNQLQNCFGCVSLRHKSYCVLNKQYSKESFDKLRTKIIQHMSDAPYIDKKGRVYKYGEAFPIEFSPFAYNESAAMQYYPLSKEEAINKGYSWKDPEERNYQITLKSQDLPDHIKDVKDDILNQIIECAHKGKCNEHPKQESKDSCQASCTAAFKIIPQELGFYRKMNLPLPRLCPNCRHYQRIKQRNPLKLWKRQCQCAGEKSANGVYSNTASHPQHSKTQPCSNEFETTYAPERSEIVYCEACYTSEVV